MAAGLGNREIAEQLHLSRYTVERHIKHIYRKLLVSSRTKAVHPHARAAGWIKHIPYSNLKTSPSRNTQFQA